MAAQVGLCLTWSETPEDTFYHDEAHLFILKFSLSVAMVINQMHTCTEIMYLVEDFSRNTYVKFLSKYLQSESKNDNFHFSHYKSLGA